MLIILFCSCFAWIWTTELTQINGLLSFIPKFYPYPETIFGKILRCSICLSGWLCLGSCLAFGIYSMAIPYMFFSMALTKVLIK